MVPSTQSHSRSHSILLLQRLLNLRDNSSPLTLVLDSLEQSAAPILREFIGRAKISRTKVVLVSFATVKKPHDVDVFIKAVGKPLRVLSAEIAPHCPPPAPPTAKETPAPSQKALLLIDSLNPLASSTPELLPAFLSAIISPGVSVVSVYHADVPLVPPPAANEYSPDPLTLLTHLATAVLRVSSLYQAAERRRAQNRSLPEPEWGLREGREGVLVGAKLGEQDATARAVVVEMELRRRSGRAVAERFVVAPAPPGQPPRPGAVSLLSDHPLLAPPPADAAAAGEDGGAAAEEMGTTFSLGLTEKQRRDREGIVLPYFDAQTDIGAGEGGRILYEMGREDDFDEEEDEI